MSFQGRELHFIAIGGAGMSGLALVCHAMGARVTGTDRAESAYFKRVVDAGIQARLGHDPEAVPADAEIVVSSAIPDDNPELERARERGQRILHRGQLLAEVCAQKRLIAVAGAHGKTTTAGMLAWIGGRDVAYLLGGELPGLEGGPPTNAHWAPDAEWVVAEADESDASFLELRPEVAVVTNVELDHHARWSSRAELVDAFRSFAEPASSLVLGADPSLEAVIASQGGVVRFDAGSPGPSLELAVPGEHNLLNARAAFAAAQLAGLGDDSEIADRLGGFPGMLRRLERKGARGDAEIYDDYAHHPTEVAASLAALRGLGPRRLIAVFQPHLYSRTKALADRFGRALSAADEVAVLDVYPAREEPVGELAGVSGLDVARATADRAGGKPVWWLPDRDRAADALGGRLRDGDLLVTIGAGDVFLLAESLVDGA
jgi:UDP-N-acetylmuramate--alanine ligase